MQIFLKREGTVTEEEMETEMQFHVGYEKLVDFFPVQYVSWVDFSNESNFTPSYPSKIKENAVDIFKWFVFMQHHI